MEDTKLTPQQFFAALEDFHGSENYYRHLIGGMIYTDGVKFVAERSPGNGSFWLIDAIGSYQYEPKVKRLALQVWELKVHDPEPGRTYNPATLILTNGNRREVLRQEFQLADFPQPGIKLWLENRTLYLPGER